MNFGKLVGRKNERARLISALQTLLRGGDGGGIIIEGEAGIGKTRLLVEFLEQAAGLNLNSLYGSGNAIEKINNSPLDELVITNTIPIREKAKQCTKIKVLSVAPLFAKAIQRIHNGDSISVLF